MAKSAQSVVMAAAAVLLLVASAVLVSRAGDDTPATAVLGRQLSRSTESTTSTAPATTTTTALVVTNEGTVIVGATTTTTAPAPPAAGVTTTTARKSAAATTTTAQGVPGQRVVEKADTTSSFEYRADGTGTMTTEGTPDTRDTFNFSALGSDVDHDGVAELRSEMANKTDREIVFPDGLVLRFVLTREGQPFRTVELRFPDTQSLPAGGSLEVETATPLQQQYGHFAVTGEATVQYR